MKVDEHGNLIEEEQDPLDRKLVQMERIGRLFHAANKAIFELSAQLMITGTERADGEELTRKRDGLRLLGTSKRVAEAHDIILREATRWLKEEQQ